MQLVTTAPTVVYQVEERDGTLELVQRVRLWMGEHARYVQTRDELMALSDRELHDIGLNRIDVETIARRSCRQG